MSKVYGYVRISTLDQNEDRQLDAMEKCEVPQKNVYVDKLSGKDFNRPHYQRMVKKLRSGDVFTHSNPLPTAVRRWSYHSMDV